MVMSGIKDNNREKAIKFIHGMGERMSLSNNDGLGYAAVDKYDNMFGERWFNNKNAFKKPIENKFKNIKFKPIEYNSFGNVNMDEISSILLHTRFATCEKNLRNVHPFVKDDTALIHNGVISNPHIYNPTISTCDSESLLNGYLEHDVKNNTDTLDEMVKPLNGYWATALLTKINGSYVIDIFKYNRASLEVLYIYDIDAWVFTTNANDASFVCDKLGYSYSESGDVQDLSYLRINPQTGEVLFDKTYKKDYPYETKHYSYQGYVNESYETWQERRYGATNKALPYSQINKKEEEPIVEIYTGKEFSNYILNKTKQ
jgi:hypothetical protein